LFATMPGTRTSVSDRLTIGCCCWISRWPIASIDAGTSRLRSLRRVAVITSGSSVASAGGKRRLRRGGDGGERRAGGDQAGTEAHRERGRPSKVR
jgi:hypothetical protein